MSKVQMLNALVKQRLTAAAEEIFGLFERTIAEYEEERCRSKEENERQRNLLDAVFNPQLQLHRTDVHQLSASKEIERGSLQGLEGADVTKFPFNLQHDTENRIGDSSEPAPGDSGGCRVTRAARSGLKSLEKDDVPVSDTRRRTVGKQFSCSKCTKRFVVKSSLKRHMTTHIVGKPLEDCEGPEPAKNLDPDRHPEPKTDDQTGDSSEPETDDSEDQEDTAKAQSNLKSLKKDDVPVSDTQSSTGKKEFSCSKCTKRFGLKSSLKRHMRTHTVKKCCSCSVCNKGFQMKSHLQRHMIIHTGEKAFSCSVCEKRFGYKATLQQHMATHTGEKRLRCSVCDQRFTWHSQLRKHRAVCCKPSRLRRRQTERMEREANREDRGGPGPARKSEPRRYSEPKTDDQTGDSSEPETDDSEDQEETIEAQSGLMSLGKDEVPVSETRCRTGTKEFSCSKCTKRFGFKSFLKRHMRTHLEEKLVHCPVCKRGFRREIHLQGHMITHTGEKPFRCSVCKQCFAWSCNLKRHMRTHRGSKRVHCRV
ncbi:oocyte zinc finger protein XlCOF6-like isoform X1 [Etheostoma cragini]|uniref:oocyte zinc finger protein XlCOF6-like isoform X1 n=1 Tax=Etheostoma cragini TaxID=417921 RepID=UPI00155E6010|nr:oocyte zinc finger protein XlCOF6-like isoform X1 [Etheostoma cragini]